MTIHSTRTELRATQLTVADLESFLSRVRDNGAVGEDEVHLAVTPGDRPFDATMYTLYATSEWGD